MNKLVKGLKGKFRRSLAGFLAFCLVFTSFNIESLAGVRTALGTEEAIFILDGVSMLETAQRALDAGEVFDKDSLGLGEEDKSLKKEYEKLFGGNAVYEFMPEYDMDEKACPDGAELRLFVRVPNLEDGYQLTGAEEIIFLYVNNSESRIIFRSNIDGYLTQKVSVKAFSESLEFAPEDGIIEGEKEGDRPEETEKPESNTDSKPEVTEKPENDTDSKPEKTEKPESNKSDSGSSDSGNSSSDSEKSSGSGSSEDKSSAVEVSRSLKIVPMVMAPEDEGEAEATEAPVEETEAADEPEETEVPTPEATEPEAETAPSETTEETTEETTDAASGESAPENATDATEATDAVETETVADENKGTTSGKTYGAVLLDESYYARAYVTTFEQLHVEAAIDGYSVRYSVDPVGTATVKGPSVVEENGVLTFTVTPQVGYAVDTVTANGDEVSVDETETGRTKTYTIPEVSEGIEVEVTTAETDEHPAFDEQKTLNGVTVRVSAEEGILPAGTELKVVEVTQQLEAAVKEKVEAEAAESEAPVEVTSVLAYDITLWNNGEELDNSWSENGYVSIEFLGSKIAEKSKAADTVEILCATKNDEKLSAKNVDGVNAETLELSNEGREVIDVVNTESTDSIKIDVEHFTIYAPVFYAKAKGFTVTYDATGGKGAPIDSNRYASGDTVIVNFDETPSKDNASFLGWTATRWQDTPTYTEKKGTFVISKSTSLYAVWANKATKFFILNPGQGEPATGADQGAGNYFPNNNNNGGVSGANTGTGFPGGRLTYAGYLKVPNQSNENFNKTGINDSYYIVPKDLGEFTGRNITWYVLKNQAGGYHIDGYLEDQPINVHYHANYTEASKEVYTEPEDIYSGHSYTIRDYKGTKLSKREGYTFNGWNTKKDVTGNMYLAGEETELSDTTNLYASWLKDSNLNYAIEYYLQKVNKDGERTYDKVPDSLESYPGTVNQNVDAGNKSFDGFEYDESAPNHQNGIVTGVSPLILKRYYKALESRIRFVTNGGSEISDKTGSTNQEIEERTIPSTIRSGYILEGWYGDQAFTPITKTTELPDRFPMGTKTYYAKWTADNTNLSYDGNGATEGSTAATTGKVDAAVTVASNGFTKPGYTFTGWNTQADGQGTGYAEGSNYTLTAETDMLYAQWTAATDTKYKVESYFQNQQTGEYEIDAELTDANRTGTTEETASVIDTDKATVKENYIFDESNTLNVRSAKIAADGGTVLKVYFKLQYKVTFVADDEEWKTELVNWNGDATAPTNPAKTGYEFAGWNKEYTGIKADTVVNAKWTVNTYTVSYEYVGAVPSGASALPESVAYDYGEVVTVAEPSKAVGYIFSGWNWAQERAAEFNMPARDVVIKGSFTAIGDTAYKVEHYLQNMDDTGFTLKETESRVGATDSPVTAVEKIYEGFTFDNTIAGTALEGVIAGDGSLTLRLYYVRNMYSYKVNYLELNTNSVLKETTTHTAKFAAEIAGIQYNTEIAGYTYNSVNPTNLTIGVNENHSVINVYYTKNSSGGGSGGGGGSTGGSGGSSGGNPTGPGRDDSDSVIIEPEAVPLASLPPTSTNGTIVIIEDSEVPLAALPKTGESTASEKLMLLFAGMMIAVYASINAKKKKED